jgi:hypothetical protein
MCINYFENQQEILKKSKEKSNEMSNGKENNSFNVMENVRKVRSNRAKAVILDNSLLKLAKEGSNQSGSCIDP